MSYELYLIGGPADLTKMIMHGSAPGSPFHDMYERISPPYVRDGYAGPRDTEVTCRILRYRMSRHVGVSPEGRNIFVAVYEQRQR